MSINSDDFLDLVNDNDSMRNHIGNWHVLNLNRIEKNKKKNKKQDERISSLESRLAAFEASLASSGKK